MTYIYYDNEGTVKMMSEGKLDAPNFSFIKKILTIDEKDKLHNSYKYYCKVKNGKTDFTEKEFVKKAKIIENIKKDLNSGGNTKEIINKLLNII